MSNLMSTTKTEKMRKKIMYIASTQFPGMNIGIFWEHGHWWLRVFTENAEYTYDVVDANTESGIDFELVDEVEL